LLRQNKMKKIALIFVVAFFCLTCKKNALGDDCIIEGTVKHHNKTITNATVFIKFNAAELPGEDTTTYDAKVRVDKDGYFKFNTLKGHYFLYASGIDPGIPPPYIVVGGQGVKLRKNENVTLTLFVTEGD
jgi:hypothetical protein